jgi:hypothetical protein
MTTSITEPLRLAVGSHLRGSGYGCAMNVIAWETGDPDISDLPACSDKFLARMIHGVNDSLCKHTELKTYEISTGPGEDDPVVQREARLLCPACSMKALDLAHRTVGTYLVGNGGLEVWMQILTDRLVNNVRHWERLRRRGERDAKIFMARETIKACQEVIAAKDQINRQNLLRDAQERVWKAREAATMAYAPKVPSEVFEMASCFDTFLDDEFDADFLFARDEQGKEIQHRMLLSQAHRIIDRFEELADLKAPEVDFAAVERAFLEMSKIDA